MIFLGYAFMCLVFGTTFLAIKVGVTSGLPPFMMAGIRFLGASLVVLPVMGVLRVRFPRKVSDYAWIAWLGTLMTTIPFAALFWAEQYISSGLAALLVAAAPLFMAVFQRTDKIQWVGFGFAVVGLYFVVAPDFHQAQLPIRELVAKAVVVVSECFFAYGLILTKRRYQSGVSVHVFNGLQMAFSGITLLVLSLVTEHVTSVHFTYTSSLSLVYLAVVPSVIASGIYYWLVRITNPIFPTTWTYISPIIAMALGALFLHEPMTSSRWIGVCSVMIGVFFINRKIFRELPRSLRTGGAANKPGGEMVSELT